MAVPFGELKADWLAVADAVDRVLSHGAPLDPRDLPPSLALGRILSAPVTARATLPPFDNSAMDGYAARADDVRGASDVPIALRVVASTSAGADRAVAVEAGTAVRIMTGAPLPPGADSVVRVEDTDREVQPGIVRIHDDRDAGRNVRAAGRDFLEGDRLLDAGHRMTASAIGLATAGGADAVRVHPAPRVTIVTNGDELVGPEEYGRVREGRAIPDTNGPMIEAAVTAAGGSARRLPIVRDTMEALVEALGSEMDTDVLVTIGGASMGTEDLIKRALSEHGFVLDFWRVLMRPGSPFGFGVVPRATGRPLPVLSLPGNPASAFVTFELFGRPLIRSLAAEQEPFRASATARAGEAFDADPRLTLFPRVALAPDESGTLRAVPAGAQSSGLVGGLARAHGLGVIPPADSSIPVGAPLRVLLLEDTPNASREPTFLDPVGRQP